MFTLHVHACCMSMHVHAACPCMFTLHVHACPRMLKVQVDASAYSSMFTLHVESMCMLQLAAENLWMVYVTTITTHINTSPHHNTSLAWMDSEIIVSQCNMKAWHWYHNSTWKLPSSAVTLITDCHCDFARASNLTPACERAMMTRKLTVIAAGKNFDYPVRGQQVAGSSKGSLAERWDLVFSFLKLTCNLLFVSCVFSQCLVYPVCISAVHLRIQRYFTGLWSPIHLCDHGDPRRSLHARSCLVASSSWYIRRLNFECHWMSTILFF